MSALHISVQLVLLLTSSQTNGYVSRPVSLTISGSQRQVFEYESLSLGCDPTDSSEESSVWIIWRFTYKSSLLSGSLSWCGSRWGESSPTTCLIATSKQSDSGLYWCQSSLGDSSSALQIHVTGGHVILESPVLPVMEGHHVTLSCKTKTPSSSISAEFYKDGVPISTEPTARMTIYNVSKSDEGLYRCSVTGLGHSPESWLAVRGVSVHVSLSVSHGSQQVFEYQHMTLVCGGSGGGWRVWRVVLPAATTLSACGGEWGESLAGRCQVNFTKKYDTATYWCRSDTGQQSNMVNITVHDGHVILESPVLPVTEGHHVTLSCKTKTPSSSISAEFYKDGVPISTEPTARMTIYNVSKSDEGLYRCSVSGLGQSPESWLAVRDVPGGHVILESPVLPVTEGHHVTLSCKTKTPSSSISAEFYKDGVPISTEPTGRMTIYNVSKSDEGLYRCSVSGLGHSPESWLTVRAEASALPLLMRAVRYGVVVPLLAICTALLLSVWCFPTARSRVSEPRAPRADKGLDEERATADVTSEQDF